MLLSDFIKETNSRLIEKRRGQIIDVATNSEQAEAAVVLASAVEQLVSVNRQGIDSA